VVGDEEYGWDWATKRDNGTSLICMVWSGLVCLLLSGPGYLVAVCYGWAGERMVLFSLGMLILCYEERNAALAVLHGTAQHRICYDMFNYFPLS
jgi:hypothetical protein